jgi:hypothetical protein
MSAAFTPRVDILPEAPRRLWPELRKAVQDVDPENLPKLNPIRKWQEGA